MYVIWRNQFVDNLISQWRESRFVQGGLRRLSSPRVLAIELLVDFNYHSQTNRLDSWDGQTCSDASHSTHPTTWLATSSASRRVQTPLFATPSTNRCTLPRPPFDSSTSVENPGTKANVNPQFRSSALGLREAPPQTRCTLLPFRCTSPASSLNAQPLDCIELPGSPVPLPDLVS